jgi:hypothetical protein
MNNDVRPLQARNRENCDMTITIDLHRHESQLDGPHWLDASESPPGPCGPKTNLQIIQERESGGIPSLFETEKDCPPFVEGDERRLPSECWFG